jgi:hypothetical protein
MMKRTSLWIGFSGLVLVLLLALMPVSPTYAVDITVTTTNDVLDAAAGCAAVTVASLPGPDGVTSLREAMCAANNNPASDTIRFNIPGCGGVCTIQPTIALPVLSGDGTTIDGYSQPGSAEATAGTPATLLIEIDGSSVLSNNGLNVASAGNVVRGLVINRFGGNGIAIGLTTATGNTISGNHIGTNAAGTAGLGNGLDGVFIGLGAQGNTVGGDTPADRNVISGNGLGGVAIHRSDTVSNTIRGNYIGTDASGALDRGNTLHGVYVYGGTHDNTVGPGNVISGNDGDGVRIYGADTTSNTVSANYIGTDAAGTASLGNGGNGIYIANGAHDNAVGPGNVLSGNDNEGVAIYDSGTTGNVVSGNYIGTDGSGAVDLGNTWDGIIIGLGAQANTVGPDNVISGNDADGVRIVNSGTMSNTVSGNLIGTDGSGTADLGNTSDGVIIAWGARNNTVGPDNVISSNGQHGVFISEDDTMGNVVSGNLVGTDVSGTADLGNSKDGILIGYGAQDNTVGPDNVISGNDWHGIEIYEGDTTGNVVSDNRIGTDAAGTADLGNSQNGVSISAGAHGNTVGPDNVISGNNWNGVSIHDSGTTGNVVAGNIIGADAGGTADLGNANSGIIIWGGAQDNTIGPDNVIAHHLWDGVMVEGSGTVGNAITQNSILSNTMGMGIDLVGEANGSIAAPEILTATLGSVHVVGTACPGCTVELFENGDTDGEGETYVGDATADAGGAFTVTVSRLSDAYLTATATDAFSGTSEFSAVFTATVMGGGTTYLPVALRNY